MLDFIPIVRIPIIGLMNDLQEVEQQPAAESGGKVVNLAFYRIKKSLQSEGFDLISDDDGNLTLVMRLQK